MSEYDLRISEDNLSKLLDILEKSKTNPNFYLTPEYTKILERKIKELQK